MSDQDIRHSTMPEGTLPGDSQVKADGAMQYFGLTLDRFLSHAAKWHPDAEVVTARPDGRLDRIGYAGLLERARRVSALLAGLGAGLSSRVATLAWNTQAHLEVWYGVMGIGATCHTLNPRVTAEQSAAMLRKSGAHILIVSGDLIPLAERIVAQTDTVTQILVIDGEQGAWMGSCSGLWISTLDPSGCNADNVVWGNFDENTPSGLCFTSGTTGEPKGVTYTHRSSYLHTLRLLQADMLGITRQDCVLAMVPMFHAGAWGLPFAAPAVGAKFVLPGPQPDSGRLAALIATEQVTLAAGVPTVWLSLVDHLEKTGGELPSLKRILVGGAPMPPALMEKIERRMGVTIQTSWGMTELSPAGTMASPGDPMRAAAVSGRPAIGIDLLLKDAEGRVLSQQRNVEGHLHVRGAAVLERYLGFEDKATDGDGWFCTGDLARIDTDGNLTITGRAKDLIKSGGEWINPAEIEAIVGALPEVSFAAVIGRPDEKWGERPLLIVEMTDASVIDEVLLAPLRKKLVSWWIPDAIIRIESMPKAATGKIDKMRLRAEYGR